MGESTRIQKRYIAKPVSRSFSKSFYFLFCSRMIKRCIPNVLFCAVVLLLKTWHMGVPYKPYWTLVLRGLILRILLTIYAGWSCVSCLLFFLNLNYMIIIWDIDNKKNMYTETHKRWFANDLRKMELSDPPVRHFFVRHLLIFTNICYLFRKQFTLNDDYLAARCLCSQRFSDSTWERHLATNNIIIKSTSFIYIYVYIMKYKLYMNASN